MTQQINIMVHFRQMIKLYDSMLKEVCERYDLSLIEATIISFLHNNPAKDTAGDIVELRMLSKGNVSQAVELLIQKSLLSRKQDKSDRRKIHLSLLPNAHPITEAIEELKLHYFEQLFYNFSEEEKNLFFQLNKRMMENTKNIGKRREIL